MAVSAATPHDLDLVVDFVNTLDPDTDSDELATGAGLDRWLRERGLLARSARGAGERERREAIELREALRAVMLEHNGAGPVAGEAEVLDRVARSGELSVHFAGAGEAALEPRAAGVAGALARLLVPVFEATLDGSWERVKACRDSDCQWAFYDRSRNRSGVWCDMAVCGNRAKVRSYRTRRSGAQR